MVCEREEEEEEREVGLPAWEMSSYGSSALVSSVLMA